MHFSNLMLPSSTMKADHAFACAASKCKLRMGGVCRFQDSKDKASMANLKHHATCCFGEDMINAAIAGKQASECNSSIFAFFAHKGKQLVKYLHHAHMNPEVRISSSGLLKTIDLSMLSMTGSYTIC